MWRYVLLLVWPRQLSNDYSYAQIPLAQGTVLDWIGCLLLVGGALAALWQARRNRPVLFFAWFSFVTFLPVSNLLFATGTILGERLMYLPSAGLVAIVAIALRASLARAPRPGGALPHRSFASLSLQQVRARSRGTLTGPAT